MQEQKIASLLQRFISFYQSATKDNLHLLSTIYADNIVFEDPAHRIQGFAELTNYFSRLYSHVNKCQFHINEVSQVENTAFVTWRMQLSHPKLAKGKTCEVFGCSHIKFANDLVVYQRDYFDLGEMLYQNLPILGQVVHLIKKRFGQ